MRKVTKGPFEISKYHILSFGDKFLKIAQLVLELCGIVKKGPWEFQKWKIYFCGPCTNGILQEWSLGDKLVKLHNQSLKFGELAKIVLGYFKSEIYQTYPCTI